ncbi:glycoside hydrolase family 2 protein [Streptomyces sp. MP131-18]|uniref:glycoside hydrolase family 2 protein n=1 Tax=Streptomyces sp. MP131-18 TaxID=1857892 RepID=UPI00097CBF8D|nr:glycoside hydrolase family 2 protein [Streptomyces sp. MP131-18]ONK09952.1 Exo-beta-D-glucosaminidase precursor [Streptomyces sp. MP131-18]
MIRHALHDGWHLTAAAGPVPEHIAGRTVPAQVPGSAHLDLLAQGLIPDPYLDRAEEELAWAHRTDWRYATTVTAGPAAADERVDLVFEGLDTVADIQFGGQALGTVANMHRSYRFDVRELLTGRETDLVVTFRSALAYAEEIQERLGSRPRAYPHPMNTIRKMACSFGWDWGPDLQTAGIWKPVRLERWRVARLAEVRPLVTVAEDGTGRAEVHAVIERSGLGEDTELALTATVDGRTVTAVVPAGATTAQVTVEVPDARLWWPVGHGDQPLYDLEIGLAAGGRAGTPLHTVERRIGFRTITVDTTPDEHGTPFTFVVNGRPVFAKGANWIPDDHFLTRITRERLERRVDQAVGAHMNMLRVWGGGIYETEDFYDVCDERGILVWQDFLLACAAYPEEEPLWGEFEAEARENVARLTSHPSLALWNGGNENLWGWMDWGWQEELKDLSWGLRYYTELFPRIVAELDPTRAYADGSPYSPRFAPQEMHPNEQDHGTRHEWAVWNRVDYTHYRDHIPRFCSEFGFQGPPTWATLTRWIHDEPMTPTSPGFLLHQKAEDGNGKLDRGMAPHLPEPRTFEDWHWATQLNQARAVAFGIEHFRSHWPRTAGSLVWQLNDCWPVTSWAAVDGDERPKPLWYGLRHAHAPRLLTVQPRDGRPTLVTVNDTDEPWNGQLLLKRLSFAGEVLDSATISLDVSARSVAEIELADSLLKPADAAREVLVATAEGTRAVHLFAEDRDLAYDPQALTAEAVAVPGGYRVDVRATSFARDVAILADRVAPDAQVDDMLVPVLPGETRSFTVRTEADLDPALLTGPLVLRSAGSLHSVPA